MNPRSVFYFSAFSQLVVAVAAITVRRNLRAEMKLLAAYFIIALVVTVTQFILGINGINNLWTIRLFAPIEFVILIYVFYRWNRRSLAGTIMLYAIPTYFILWVAGFTLLESDIYSYLDPIAYACIVLAAARTLLDIDRSETTPVLRVPSFWISSAATIYFGSTVVLLSLNRAIFNTSQSTWLLAWSVQAIMNIVGNLIYAWAFLCLRNKT